MQKNETAKHNAASGKMFQTDVSVSAHGLTAGSKILIRQILTDNYSNKLVSETMF